MSRKSVTGLLKYGLTSAIVLAMAGSYIAAKDLKSLNLAGKYTVLSDAFALPAVLLLGLGALIWASNLGALDGLGYSLKVMVRMLKPGKGPEQESYREYLKAKQERRVKGYGFLLIIGGICLAISLIFLALFHKVY